jgi:hypothetical protein
MTMTFYAEYNNTGKPVLPKVPSLPLIHTSHVSVIGPGSNHTWRVSDHILTDDEAKTVTIDNVFLGTPEWIDFNYVY